jgi:ribosomal protein S27E
MAIQPKFDFLKVKDKEKKKRGECSECGGQATSFSRDSMVWKRCLSCPNTWALGGTSLFFKLGADRQEIKRDLIEPNELIPVGDGESKRAVSSWEQDQQYLNSNNQRYVDFLHDTNDDMIKDDYDAEN